MAEVDCSLEEFVGEQTGVVRPLEGYGDVSCVEMFDATWLLTSDSASEAASLSKFELDAVMFWRQSLKDRKVNR